MKKSYTSAFKTQVILELLKDEKSLNQLASEYSVHPNVIREWKAVALKGFPGLFERRDTLADATTVHEQQVQDLYAQIGRFTTQLAWIKKNLASTLTRRERRGLVEFAHPAVPLIAQADILSLSRSSL